MNITQAMNRNVQVCLARETLDIPAARMWEHDIGCLPVLDEDGRVIAVITDRDICMAAYTQARPLHEIPVSVAMSKELFFCRPEATIAEGEEIMRRRQVRRLPVLDADNKILGIVTLGDLTREAEAEIEHDFHDVGIKEVIDTWAAINAPRMH